MAGRRNRGYMRHWQEVGNMLYLISDIHGDMIGFRKLLKKIAFDKEKDNMIIAGDIVDRGPDGIKLLEFIRPYIEDGSMELLLGNHELFAIMYLQGKLDARTWISFGGEATVSAVNEMDANEQERLLSFLKGLPYYAEINSKYFGNVVITHTGIDADNFVFNTDKTINVKKSIEKAMENNCYMYLVGMDLHFLSAQEKRRLDAYLIVGHVPCCRLNEDMSYKFYRTRYYMDIDSGAGHKDKGGIMGCYCVDNDAEIYV